MARPGLSAEHIEAAIRELETEGGEVTVNRVRDRLGTGSYSTISQVLGKWREARLKAHTAAIPEVPEALGGLLTQLWREAWQSADRFHQEERQAFLHERGQFSKTKEEMSQEILRLEGEVSRLKEEADDAAAREAERALALQDAQLELASTQGRLEMAQAEAERLRAGHKQLTDTVAAWTERATKAEARVEELSAELTRQKEDITRLTQAAEAAEAQHTARAQELESTRHELASAQSRLEALQAEAERLRADHQKLSDHVAHWVERATRAETRLEEGQKKR
jgi:chromosome segregation ATPase